MDVERYLISKILGTRDISQVADAGVTAKLFLAKDHREKYTYITRHMTAYGNVPSVAAFKADFPNYKLLKVEDTFDFLLTRLRDIYRLSVLEDGVTKAVDAVDQSDAKLTQQLILQAVKQVEEDIPSTRDTDLTRTGDSRLSRYAEYKNMPDGLRGIPTGFVTLDKATLGLQNQQLVTLVGPPKAGKSTLLLLCAKAAHSHGENPLFVGFEMSNEEQEERFDALNAKISHTRLRSGKLNQDEWKKLDKSIRRLEEMQPFILSSDSASLTTLTGIRTKVDTIKPSVLFVDGIYMMDDEEGESKNSPQALTNLTRGFKKMAQQLDIPIVITTQVLEWKMKKKEITSDSIGYSSSFAQDSDTIIGALPVEGEADLQKLSIVLSRNCPKIEALVRWDWETGSFAELENQYEEDLSDEKPTY